MQSQPGWLEIEKTRSPWELAAGQGVSTAEQLPVRVKCAGGVSGRKRNFTEDSK